MKKPLVSFVIPCFNKEAYIAECLSSIKQQTNEKWEAIIVDDCSTDDSKTIIEWFCKDDKRFKLIDLDKNVGRSEARNIGNAKASANIILVQDADDIAINTRVASTIKKFKSPKVDIVYGSFFVGNQLGQIFGKSVAIPFDIEKSKTDKLNYIAHSTMAYKKKVLDKVTYTSGKYSELGIDDWKFQLDAYKKGFKFDYTLDPLMVYRQVENSVSKTRDNQEVLKVKEEYLKCL